MPTKPRPLGNKAKALINIATDHLRIGQSLVSEGLTLMDRRPDEAAAHFADARTCMVQAENILLRLQLGHFADEG